MLSFPLPPVQPLCSSVAPLWLPFISRALAKVRFVLLCGSNLLCPLNKGGNHLPCTDKSDASFSIGGASWFMKPNSLARLPLL